MRHLALLLVLLAGCVHTQPATPATPDGRADLNARTAGRVATVHLRSGTRAGVRNLHVGPDETTWVNRLSGQPQSAPTTDVAAVSLRRGGIVRSFLIGAGIGAALGLLAWTQDDGGFLSFPPLLYIGGGAAEGGAIGAGVGAGQVDRFPLLAVPPDTPVAP